MANHAAAAALHRTGRHGPRAIFTSVRSPGRWVPTAVAQLDEEWNGAAGPRTRLNISARAQRLRKMQGQPACRAGEPSWPGRRTAAGGSWWWQSRSPRPIRAVERARLWAIVWRRPARRRWRHDWPERRWRSARTPYCGRVGSSRLGVAAMVSLQFEQLPENPVGDEVHDSCHLAKRATLGTGALMAGTRRTRCTPYQDTRQSPRPNGVQVLWPRFGNGAVGIQSLPIARPDLRRIPRSECARPGNRLRMRSPRSGHPPGRRRIHAMSVRPADRGSVR